jgi:hypothetical protein
LVSGASIEPSDIEGSVLDAVATDHLETLDASAQELAGLIVAPAVLGSGSAGSGGEELRLIGLQIDDPNGNGRLDDRWYAPRLRTEDCAVNVDAPPMPYAGASFIPGDPAEAFDGDTAFDTMEEMFDAETTVGIEVRLFDDAAQRDAFAATMVEFYGAMGDFECDFGEVGGGDGDGGMDSGAVSDMLVADMAEVELYDVGHPGVAYETSGMQGETLLSQYEVGERVLLAVSVSTPGLGSSDPGGSPDPALAHFAIDAELSAAGLT